MIVQITMTRNELFLIKEMLPVWRRYADGFVFMIDDSTDGTYEFLTENRERYNILSVLKVDRNPNSELIESQVRQALYDEALKYSPNIICLDTDEYVDGLLTKSQLEELMNTHKDTLFHSWWIQYTGVNEIRVDGPWRTNWMDRIGSYSSRAMFRNLQMHSEHLPVPANQLWIAYPHIFIAHVAWMDRKAIAIKQYFWKITDYVNRQKFGTKTLAASAYDESVMGFNWLIEKTGFPLRVNPNVYQTQKDEDNYKLQFIRDNVKKYNIPNLNDWGMNIHGT